jgi:hypothetical protein
MDFWNYRGWYGFFSVRFSSFWWIFNCCFYGEQMFLCKIKCNKIRNNVTFKCNNKITKTKPSPQSHKIPKIRHGTDYRKTKAKISCHEVHFKGPDEKSQGRCVRCLGVQELSTVCSFYRSLALAFPEARPVTCHQSYLFGDRSAQWWPLSPSSIMLNMHMCSVCTL